MKQEDYGVFTLELPGASDTFELPTEQHFFPCNSSLPQHLRERIQYAARTGIDMTKPNKMSQFTTL
jgi:hypothetical protein